MVGTPATHPVQLWLRDAAAYASAVPERVSRWRARRSSSPAWTAGVGLILAIMAVPVAAVIYLALSPADNAWPHLLATVLPESLAQTIWLAVGTGALTLTVGTGAAWLVTMYRFPGRALLDRLLVIPLAVPTYIIAYCYAEIFDYAGPAQTALRAWFGWTSVRDYWFPDIRSLGGAIFVLSAVFYPYVYLAARASFVQQSVCTLEVARTLGRTSMGAFWSVALPLARPGLAAGTALVVMECFNDLGAVQHLGVQTLSASIYSTWLQRSNLGGAAQLATVMLTLVVVLFALERLARGGAKIHHTTGRYRAIPFQDIKGWRGYAAASLCALPFLAGFVLPFSVLVSDAIGHANVALDGGFLLAAWHSLLLSTITALVAVALALLLTYARRVAANGFTRPAVRIAGLGYALPGTVLAIGILIPLAGLDNHIDALFRSLFGISTGLLISGTMAALIYAYVIRFLGVAVGGIEAGLERVSPNLDAAARALGETALSTLWRVHLPLLLPALGAAGLLVFVDTLKELPATLLLRPFNFETLSTHVYGFAALEQIEGAALGALTIVLAGLVPLILLHRAIAGGRAGSLAA
jgi:iron(III) transport system permease protein